MSSGSKALINCPYCHTSVVVPEALRQSPDAALWATLLFDRFVTNENNWLVRNQPSEHFARFSQTIADGRYRWEAEVSHVTSISTAWLTGYAVDDFHLRVSCKHIAGSKGGSSWGVLYRVQDNRNYYYFRMTDSQQYAVSVIETGSWRNIVEWTRSDTIRPYGVNQLEVIGREAQFSLLINGQLVQEVTDAGWGQGFVGVAIEGYIAGEQTAYDFLDFLLRARR
ncbi:MAG: hypothetical protein IT308_02750 [Anaerolineaceae bacterium]|nr:hypothetical protein [Anaerolineaceae bacterium]